MNNFRAFTADLPQPRGPSRRTELLQASEMEFEMRNFSLLQVLKEGHGAWSEISERMREVDRREEGLGFRSVPVIGIWGGFEGGMDEIGVAEPRAEEG